MSIEKEQEKKQLLAEYPELADSLDCAQCPVSIEKEQEKKQLLAEYPELADSLDCAQKCMEKIAEKLNIVTTKTIGFRTKTKNKRTRKCLNELFTLYFMHEPMEHKKVIADQLVHDNAGQIFTEYMKALTNDGKKSPINGYSYECLKWLRFVCCTYCKASFDFCEDLRQMGMFTLLAADLVTFKQSMKDKEVVSDIILPCLHILHNCAKAADNKRYFKESHVVDAVIPYSKADDDPELKMVAMMTLSYIIEEKDNEAILADGSMIKFILSNLEGAMQSDDHMFNGSFAEEIVSGLMYLARNDNNEVTIVNEGVLPMLVQLMEKGSASEKAISTKTVWILSFSDMNKTKIREEKDMMKYLEFLSNSAGPARESASGALWILDEEERVKRILLTRHVTRRPARESTAGALWVLDDKRGQWIRPTSPKLSLNRPARESTAGALWVLDDERGECIRSTSPILSLNSLGSTSLYSVNKTSRVNVTIPNKLVGDSQIKKNPAPKNEIPLKKSADDPSSAENDLITFYDTPENADKHEPSDGDSRLEIESEGDSSLGEKGKKSENEPHGDNVQLDAIQVHEYASPDPASTSLSSVNKTSRVDVTIPNKLVGDSQIKRKPAPREEILLKESADDPSSAENDLITFYDTPENADKHEPSDGDSRLEIESEGDSSLGEKGKKSENEPHGDNVQLDAIQVHEYASPDPASTSLSSVNKTSRVDVTIPNKLVGDSQIKRKPAPREEILLKESADDPSSAENDLITFYDTPENADNHEPSDGDSRLEIESEGDSSLGEKGKESENKPHGDNVQLDAIQVHEYASPDPASTSLSSVNKTSRLDVTIPSKLVGDSQIKRKPAPREEILLKESADDPSSAGHVLLTGGLLPEISTPENADKHEPSDGDSRLEIESEGDSSLGEKGKESENEPHGDNVQLDAIQVHEYASPDPASTSLSSVNKTSRVDVTIPNKLVGDSQIKRKPAPREEILLKESADDPSSAGHVLLTGGLLPEISKPENADKHGPPDGDSRLDIESEGKSSLGEKGKESEIEPHGGKVQIDAIQVHEYASPDPKHIMISYQWSCQQLMIRVKERLKKLNYRVWIDIESMGGSTLQAMAKAVEDSEVILICISQKYKDSPNCRTEAEYAYKLGKTVIPLRVEKMYEPDGWLGALEGSKLYFDFSNDMLFENTFSKLLKEIGERGKVAIDSQPDGPIPPPMTAHPAFAQPDVFLSRGPEKKAVEKWEKKDVDGWASANHITSKEVTNLDGESLLFLSHIKSTAPEYFYKHIADKLGITDVRDIKNLCKGLSSLEL